MKLSTALGRAAALKCPVCGEASISRGVLSTKDTCPHCQADLAVEPGYYLGAIYFNYGITAFVALATAIPLVFVAGFRPFPVVVSLAVFCFLFPLWFFRYARSLWLATDHYYHQRRRSLARSQQASFAKETLMPAAEDKIGCICPMCHHRFETIASLSRTWSHCEKCGEPTLLLPVFHVANVDDPQRDVA